MRRAIAVATEQISGQGFVASNEWLGLRASAPEEHDAVLQLLSDIKTRLMSNAGNIKESLSRRKWYLVSLWDGGLPVFTAEFEKGDSDMAKAAHTKEAQVVQEIVRPSPLTITPRYEADGSVVLVAFVNGKEITRTKAEYSSGEPSEHPKR